MRRSSIVFALLATVAVAAPAVAGPVALPSPWDGFGEGSWVIQKTTNKQVGDDAATAESTQRITLTKITEQAYTLKTEIKVGEEWSGSEYEMPRAYRDPAEAKTDAPKPEDLGAETLTVDGASIECRKTKVVAAGSTSISWTSEKYGVVRNETTGPAGDSKTELVKLKGVVKVKGKDVECQVTKTSFKSPSMENVTSTWASPSIPGGMVRAETSLKIVVGDARTESSSVMEVADFEKK